MENTVELLAPAGGLEQLKAAIYNGADAIYFGGEKFSARAKANNFTREELIIARRLTRKHNVKLYCAINTLIFNFELEEALNYIAFLDKIGIDALIIQDIGLLTLVRNYFPDMEIHSSTQLSIQNSHGLEFLKDLGVKRAVLPRETSLNDINIMNKTGIELEAFIHGAICICFSGQCLMSSMIGGRSGNRGACAQPCRLKYSILDYKTKDVLCENASYLSPKDLMLINSTDELIKAGVKSFKIEGRMKTPEYVATIVKFYRKAIDKALSGETYNPSTDDMAEISQVFSRDFTDAYIHGKSGKDMMNVNKPNNRGILAGRVQNCKDGKVSVILKTPLELGDKISFWTTKEGRVNISVDRIQKDGKFVDNADAKDIVILDVPKRVNRDDRVFKIESSNLKKKISEQILSFENEEKIPLDITVTGKIGEKLSIEFVDSDGYGTTVTSDILLEEAIKHPLDEIQFKNQMRLGESEFTLNNLTMNVEKVMVPKSILNNMRREGIENLNNLREKMYDFEPIILRDKDEDSYDQKSVTNVSVFVETIDKIEICLDKDVDYIYYPLANFKYIGSNFNKFLDFVKSIDKNKRNKIVIDLPRFIREEELNIVTGYLEMTKPYINSYRANTADHIYLLKSLGFNNIHGGSGLNVLNNYSYEFYKNICNLIELELSKELNISQLEELNKEAQLTIFGITELMVMEHCIIGSEIGLKKCMEKIYALKDRLDIEFPILVDAFGKNHIINSRTLLIVDEISRLNNIGYHKYLLNFILTEKNTMTNMLDLYLDIIKRGIITNDLNNEIYSLVSNFTKGHFNRGIN